MRNRAVALFRIVEVSLQDLSAAAFFFHLVAKKVVVAKGCHKIFVLGGRNLHILLGEEVRKSNEELCDLVAVRRCTRGLAPVESCVIYKLIQVLLLAVLRQFF